MKAEVRVVDNRVFLLGLDELYRSAIKPHERGELLDAAKKVADDLSTAPADVPVEGYYSEDETLTAYFRLMRALQGEHESRVSEVRHDRELQRLRDVTESPIYGVPEDSPCLIRRSRDALYDALTATMTDDWTVDALTTAAFQSASTSDEYSLVALAALGRDSVVLAALRESVVLYSGLFAAGISPKYRFEWKVDTVLERRAQQFVDTFNRLFRESLPRPCRENAEAYWNACDLDRIVGRCTCIAFDDSKRRVRYYHWAIDRDWRGQLLVSDFWAKKLWTTERYRRRKGPFFRT